MASQMRQTPEIGGNKTGALNAPERAKEMLTGTMEFPPTSQGGLDQMQKAKEPYLRQGDGTGSIPIPPDAKKLTPEMAMLVDKLGERLAFERSGTRFYDGLLGKFDVYGSFDGGPERAELERIRMEELQHFHMLKEEIERMGGDPTAVTPSANLAANTSKGVGDVIGDPRTTLFQCLEAILVAELTDNECWEGLAELARMQGEESLAGKCEQALADEEEHLALVRRWVAAGQRRGAPQAKH